MFKSATNPFFEANFPVDASKIMAGFKVPNFDMHALMDMQRKNIETITALRQAAFENLQTFMQSQTELMHQGFEETAKIMNAAISTQPSQESATHQAASSKDRA